MKTKFLIAVSAIAMMVSGAAAQDSNTTSLWNTSDQVIQSGNTFQGEAFTAESLENFSAEIALDTNESLEAVLKGWNSSSETGNQSWDLVDGSNEFTVQNFSENTSTYLVEFTASNGSVSLLDASIMGIEGNETVSGASPGGGLLTGNFFQGLGNPLTAFGNFLGDIWTGITGFLGGLIA